MFTNVLIYFLVGTLIGFFLEAIVRWTGNELTGFERVLMITLWPISCLMFVWNFIKELMK